MKDMKETDINASGLKTADSNAPERKISEHKQKKYFSDKNVFYYTMLAWPILQFVVFYILPRINAIMYSFQQYDLLDNRVIWSFEPIKQAFTQLTSSPAMLSVMKTTLLSFVVCTGIGTPLGLMFAYYISKKLAGAGLFRILLFLPSVISAIVMVTIYRFFVERAVPEIVSMLFGMRIKGLMENPDTRFATIMFYNIWVSFGVNVLMYSNAMSGIAPETVEAAQIDGATKLREFVSISLPGIFPTLTTFLITGVAVIFTNQYNMYSFYGEYAPSGLANFGYYFYNTTQSAASRAEYSVISAIGLLLTCIALPLTLLVKWALEKFGPSEE